MSGKSKTSSFLYTQKNRVQLVQGGKEFFDLLEKLIEEAVHIIHFQVYIFDDDQTGQRIAGALMRAAKRGVRVYLMADGYASQDLSRNFKRQLRESGVRFRYFEPLFRSSRFYFGRRLHHKVIVVDARHSLVSGINIADRYNDVDGIPAWKDLAVYVEGESSLDLYRFCTEIWTKGKAGEPPAVLKEYLQTFQVKEPCSVRVRRNDWVKRRHEVWRSYFDLINCATESITIMCSYFLPGGVLRKRLAMAVKRGVEVKLILAGPSDVMLAKHAERHLYPWLLRHGIQVYEIQSTVLHAKVAVVDDHWVTIGSFNVNNLSALASLELNLMIRNRPFARLVKKDLEETIERDCIQLNQGTFESNLNFLNKMVHNISYNFLRLALGLFTFYFKHEEKA